MKYLLLSVSPRPYLNIGDYIQALASAQYLPHIDGFIDRDLQLKDYDGEEAKVIMNGWFMHEPANWPPSTNIHPLFVAFHLNILAEKELLEKKSIDYLKKYEPIGCRDETTVEKLRNHGVKALFSGCMTLTLGKSYKSTFRDNNIYFVDPLINMRISFVSFIANSLYGIRHPWLLRKLLSQKDLIYKGPIFTRWLHVCQFARTYSKLFTQNTLAKATFISQQSDFYGESLKSDVERLEYARKLVQKYAKASLVVTSRIHCALPCIGLETPVLFIENETDSEVSKCRFQGLRDLFNVIKLTSKGLKPNFDINDKISVDNMPINKEAWRKYYEILDQKCNEFISSNIL